MRNWYIIEPCLWAFCKYPIVICSGHIEPSLFTVHHHVLCTSLSDLSSHHTFSVVHRTIELQNVKIKNVKKFQQNTRMLFFIIQHAWMALNFIDTLLSSRLFLEFFYSGISNHKFSCCNFYFVSHETLIVYWDRASMNMFVSEGEMLRLKLDYSHIVDTTKHIGRHIYISLSMNMLQKKKSNNSTVAWTMESNSTQKYSNLNWCKKYSRYLPTVYCPKIETWTHRYLLLRMPSQPIHSNRTMH